MIRALLVINAVLAFQYAVAHPHVHAKNSVCFASSTTCGKPWHSVVCFAQDGACAERARNAFAKPPEASPHP
jgi:hypothetical protein